MRRKTIISRETSAIFSNALLFRNPVLIGALGLYPVAAAGYSLKNAAELSLLFLLVSVPVNALLCLFGMLVPQRYRPGLALAVCAACYLPAAFAADRIFPGFLGNMGMVAGLMVCNSAILARADEYAPTHIALAVAADTAGNCIGFAAVLVLVSAFREFWLTGTLRPGEEVVAFRGVSLPFAGFILLGFLAALAQWLNGRRAGKTEGTEGRA